MEIGQGHTCSRSCQSFQRSFCQSHRSHELGTFCWQSVTREQRKRKNEHNAPKFTRKSLRSNFLFLLHRSAKRILNILQKSNAMIQLPTSINLESYEAHTIYTFTVSDSLVLSKSDKTSRITKAHGEMDKLASVDEIWSRRIKMRVVFF